MTPLLPSSFSVTLRTTRWLSSPTKESSFFHKLTSVFATSISPHLSSSPEPFLPRLSHGQEPMLVPRSQNIFHLKTRLSYPTVENTPTRLWSLPQDSITEMILSRVSQSSSKHQRRRTSSCTCSTTRSELTETTITVGTTTTAI